MNQLPLYNAKVEESVRRNEMAEEKVTIRQLYMKALDNEGVHIDVVIEIEGRTMLCQQSFDLDKDQRRVVDGLAPLIRLMSPKMFDTFIQKL